MADNYAEFVNFKLRFLKKQTGHLHETVDNYVNEVSSECQRWLDVREDKQMSFNEINARLEHCIQYVTHNIEKISKETREDTASTQAVKETSTETKQTSSVSPPQASTPTSHSQPAVTGHDSDYLKQFLACFETMEMVLSSVHSVTEKMSENQTKLETQIQEMAQKQSEMEKVQTKYLTDTEKQLEEAKKRSEGMKQQEKKVASLEKDMEAMKQLEKRLSTVETQIQGMKKQEKRLGSVEKEMETVSAKQSDLEERTFVKISNLENVCDTVTSLLKEVSRLENKMSTQVGFAAYVGGFGTPVPNAGSVIQSFIHIKFNFGNHFNPSTGTFSAPVAGMYVVIVTLSQLNKGKVHVLVKQKLSNPRPNVYNNNVLYDTITSKEKTSSSGFSVVDMDAGDTLFVEVYCKEGQVKLSPHSSFSCFLVR